MSSSYFSFPRRHRLSVYILIALLGLEYPAYAVEFNTDILDAEDKENIDLSRFSEAGFVMPGTYNLSVKVNDHTTKDSDISFYERPEKGTTDAERMPVEACLTPDTVELLGLTDSARDKLTWWHEGECADFSALDGMTTRGDLSESALLISLPQAWVEYQDASWLPPSRWEDGVAGLMFDYNLNSNITQPSSGHQLQSVSGSGTAGANLGAWRLRGDWQSSYSHTTGTGDSSRRNFDWSRLYAYRTLRDLKAKLTVGEDYLTSDLFDSWRFTGLSVISDDRMLPPKLRGYAPEIVGIARTNAKVTVTQQGRVIYETTVASGPFRIQDISDAVNGRLDVRVEEQDGTIQTFQVDTATIPYLTRPGQWRYKLAAGRPSDYQHHLQGPNFSTGEFSWGVSNAWSLYGGGIAAGRYNALSVGIGRDLLELGALSADVTQSVAKLDGETLQGKSWRLSYSKRFDDFNSEVTFAGYRFSEQDYLSMGEYLDARYNGRTNGHDKELYTVTANKSFPDWRMSAYLSWSHQTYWDRQDNDRYSASVSQYFDIGSFHNLSATLSATRSEYNGRRDDSAYLTFSMPFGSGTASYNGNWDNGRYSQTAGWYERLENGDSYRLQAGTRSGKGEGLASQASGYYTHRGDLADMSGNLYWTQNGYTSAGISLSGGMTATAQGAALHPGGGRGGTRMMVSTDGVEDVPVDRNQHTNKFGIAVVPDFASYYRSTTAIDVNKLPDDIEAAGSPVAEAALTEGAIGFRRFDVLKGAKVVSVMKMADGSHPPFGASVRNSNDREVGIVSDGGLSWLSGINPGETLTVNTGGKPFCQVEIPNNISVPRLLLPCMPVSGAL
ncbi:PapC/FimD family outer membrane usher protein [Enterobacter cancerogenus]|uniref:fimbria/pilus outer membrane usher protein n=1 Tax=Enterobacter cancerogenus TaxID=69218 RepID=UPI000C99E5DF|nr:fimbria/pilus outer membrane usher protein [Enterobacter cancerogenus]PNF13475.1 PapC/FimD family outer membrane usher protein [Enterobacter cancerogenus]